jgi:hypothetical protein
MLKAVNGSAVTGLSAVDGERFNLGEAIRAVVAQEHGRHNTILRTAAHLIATKTPPDAAVSILQGAMESIPKQDRRDGWARHYAAIPAAVRSAAAKFARALADGTGTGTSSETLAVLNGSAFVADFEPPSFAIEPLLIAGQLGALTGPPNGGKTTLAILMAFAKAGLITVPGLDVPERGRVLYLAGEACDNVRVQALGLCERYSIEPPAMDDWIYWRPDAFSLSEGYPRLGTVAEQAGGFSLVIVDTRSSFNESGDENDNIAGASDADVLRAITALPGSPAVLVLCHPRKGATEDSMVPRGASAFLGALDFSIGLWTADDVVTVTPMKLRGARYDPLRFRLHRFDLAGRKDRKGRPVATVVAESIDDAEAETLVRNANETHNAILYQLLHHPDETLATWAVNCGWTLGHGSPNKMRVDRALKALQRSGLAEKVLERWTLTTAGKRAAKAIR